MIFDSHLHIINTTFPLSCNQGYLPRGFTCADYIKQARVLGVVGGAVVSGSFQGFDQTYLIAALEALGPTFVGVTQLPADVSNTTLMDLDELGVRGVRFNFKRGGSAQPDELESLARRVHEIVGWHVEVYVDGSLLRDLAPRLMSLPRVVVDHLGLVWAGLPALYKLVEHGAFVKATGFGRLDFPPEEALRQIARINPGALLFGTDLPSTRAARPFRSDDLGLVREVLDPAEASRALYENAIELYKPQAHARAASAA
jgi:predicted TIM-barrel fold metal-dependent hydrolase